MQKNADAFRTISEVAEELALPQHVLRFWETRFPQIRPLKRAGGRRYYRPGDITLLKSIRALLYEEGYTIKGVQRLLKEQGPKGVSASAPTDREPEMLAADMGDAPAESLEESPSAVAPSDATASRPEEDGAAASWTRADPGLGFDPFSAAPGHLSRDQADAGPRFGTAHADVGPLGPLQRDALETVLLVLEDCDRILAPLRRRTA